MDATRSANEGRAVGDGVVWADVEGTGLNEDRRALMLEVAFVFTDWDFVEHGSYETVIRVPGGWPAVDAALSADAPVVREMHEESGLLDEIRAGAGKPAEVVDAEVSALIGELFPGPRRPPFGGASNGGYDRGMLRAYLPLTSAAMHYRVVDVSSFREVARRRWPRVYGGAEPGACRHRAMPDVRNSVAELRRYTDAIENGHAVPAAAWRPCA